VNISVGKYRIKTKRNDNNKFWKDWGRYNNSSETLIDGIWWQASLDFRKKDNKKFILINWPMLVDKETNIITKFLHQGVYDEVQVNSFKFFILRFLMNKHPINDRLYKFKVTVFERKYTIFVFALAFFLSYVFYIFNNAEGNYLISFIANNIWAQTVIFFITISGFINIFHPFTIKKELSEKEIKRISAEIYKKNEEKKEFLEKRKNRYRL